MRFVLSCCVMYTLTAFATNAYADDVSDAPKFDEASLEFFEKEVRPLLAKRCFECHSKDSDEPGGGLRLDSRIAIVAGGDTGPAVEPGKPNDSLLIDAINYGEIYEMPPKSKMPASEIAVLTKWVSMGAPWPKEDPAAGPNIKSFDIEERKAAHWCWQPVTNPDLPNVSQASWPQKPLDHFILAKLEEAELTPAKPANKRTLIRRAYFDLIGLPPSREQIEAFLNDDSPEAFEKVIDDLLDSPHFGERWARHWMDLMRYAETYGHEFDYPIPHAYKYRDYLIRAFNADVPYDRFVMEHVAGDLIEPRLHPTEGYNESVIGTSFWWLGEATHAPVDVLGDEAGRIDNQLDVFGKTFLGLTIACARCHDHKFDAISTADYYAMAGFLQSSRRHESLLDSHGKIATAAKQLNELKQQGSNVIANAFSHKDAAGKEFSRYLLASREVLFGEPKDNATASASDDILFEDFESESYGDWTVEGEAFGKGPQSKETTPKYQGDIGAVGVRWVNSHNTRPGGDSRRGDKQTGTLTSKEFQIERSFIKFLVGGGSHKNKTCVNLLVDGKVVRSQTGFNQNKMRTAQFDVAEFLGKRGKIQVVDQETGGWGNIGVDHIVFSNGDTSYRRPIAEVADEFGIDPARLTRWVDALSDEDVKQPSHPMHAWHELAKSTDDGQFAKAASRLRSQSTSSVANLDQTHPLFTSFNDFDGWFAHDHAFGDGVTSSNEWQATDATATRLAPGFANSARTSTKLSGTLRSPTFTLEHPNIYYRMRGEGVKIRLILDGYFMDRYNGLLFRGFSFDVKSPDKFIWYHQAQDVGRYLGHRAYIEIIDEGNGWIELDEIRFSNKGPPAEAHGSITRHVLSDQDASLQALANSFGGIWDQIASNKTTAGESNVSDSDHVALWNFVARHELLPVEANVQSKLSETFAAIAKVSVPNASRVLGLTEGSEENQNVYVRGNHKALGKVAPRHVLTALSDNPKAISRGSGRLQLAQNTVSTDNPMTARVMANRVWHHMMGRGIVASTDNFGVLGQPPTHPLLLDHLASQFVQEGWSLKRLIKSIALSSTYQMASSPNEEGTERDPQNLLLHRARIRRLQGEAIRDAVLAISGRLDRKTLGPSVPVHINSFMQGRGRPKNSGPLDGDGRRSLYIEVRRNFLSPMMLAFDTPIPFNAIGRRNTSNVPAQALIMMNDPFVVEQAKLWARRILNEHSTQEDRITAMYTDAFARAPTEQELADAVSFLQTQSDALKLKAEQASNHEQLWADLCHVLMNVKEFVYLN